MKRRGARASLQLILLALVGALVGACSADVPNTGVNIDAVERYQFDSLEQMAATSDLIVEGTVSKVETGRVFDDLQYSQVTLDIRSVLLGDLEKPQLLLEEDGVTYGYSNVGDHGIWFLHWKAPDFGDYYRLVGSPGRMLESRSGALRLSNDEVSWATPLESWSLADVQAAVENAKQAIARGEVKPAVSEWDTSG